MNLNLISPPLISGLDHKKELSVLKRAIAKANKDPDSALKMLVGTGMHTKSGQLKKQFR